jgi:signal transduction histidine kinase
MNQPSLQWRLVRRLVILQAAALTLLVLLVVGTLWATGLLLDERDEDAVIDAVQTALERDADGNLTVRPTPELVRLRAEFADLWFIVTDQHGQRLTEGATPPAFARIGNALDQISQARLGWQLGEDPRRPAARLKRVDTLAANVQILTATQGRMSARKVMLALSFLIVGVVLPALVPMTLATLAVTPTVVRRSLAGLDRAAAQAQSIDISQRGTRLTLDDVPTEITPLVKAVNAALERLDEGYESHARFLADAAHELRTPIAILQTRVEALPSSVEKLRLLADIARLSVLAEQLLDLQRLQRIDQFSRVDLVPIAQRVATDLAPLAIAAKYEMAFEPEVCSVPVMGDAAALERALTNLVQNAIAHGDRKGTITIRVGRAGILEVADEGPGISATDRETIFEPFHRLRPLDRGAGLGLHLVRDIVNLHNGHISVLDEPGGGACFRMTFPLALKAILRS